MKTINDRRQWNRAANVHAWDIYAGGAGDVPPYTAPLRIQDLSGLPPAFVEVAGLDPLRDEGIEYAVRMIQSGVQSELHVFPGTYHASSYLQPFAAISTYARNEALGALKPGLASP